jgi:hypothetical protein
LSSATTRVAPASFVWSKIDPRSLYEKCFNYLMLVGNSHDAIASRCETVEKIGSGRMGIASEVGDTSRITLSWSPNLKRQTSLHRRACCI